MSNLAREHARRMRERHQARKAAGLCPKCGADRDTKLIYCARCTTMVRTSLAKSKERGQ